MMTLVAKTGKQPMLSPEHERTEFAKLPVGERIASIENLIRRCLARVDRRNRDDVYQEIILDLLASDHKYDPKRGKYTTWATWRIRHVINDQSRKHSRMSQRLLRNYVDFAEHDAEGTQTFSGEVYCEDLRAVDERDEQENQRRFLEYALRRLKTNYRAVISRRYGFGCSPMLLREISQSDGVTRQRIEQIEKTAIKEMRRYAMRFGL